MAEACGESILLGDCARRHGHRGGHHHQPGPARVLDERDLYRSALERIESHGSGEAVRIAREALVQGQEEAPSDAA